jgi:hypothetical protein
MSGHHLTSVSALIGFAPDGVRHGMASVHPEAHPEGLATGEVADRDDVDREREQADHLELPPIFQSKADGVTKPSSNPERATDVRDHMVTDPSSRGNAETTRCQ